MKKSNASELASRNFWVVSDMDPEEPDNYYFWLGDDGEVYVHENGVDSEFSKESDQ